MLYFVICFHPGFTDTIKMPIVDRLSFLSSPEQTGCPMRSDQLLRDMHKVVSHDLPNQMVVLQSLLQMLDLEESAQLSDDGREYVRRLLNATGRASDMVRFLKEMGRLNTFTCRTETIPLIALARELQGELQRLYAERHFEFDWKWHVPTIVGDTRVYLQAILELFAGLLHLHTKTCRVSAQCDPCGDALELAFHLDEKVRPVANIQVLEQRMEIILARAWLALCGAGVEVTLPASGGTRFSIVVPNR